MNKVQQTALVQIKHNSLETLERLLRLYLPETEIDIGRYEENHILISLSHSTQLNKDETVELLAEELRASAIKDVKYALVHAYLQGDNPKLCWCEKIPLGSLALSEPVASSDVAVTINKARNSLIAALTICGMPFCAWGGFKVAYNPSVPNDSSSLNASAIQKISSRTNVSRARSEGCVNNFNSTMKQLASASLDQASQTMNIAINVDLTYAEFAQMAGVLSTRMFDSCANLDFQSIQITSGEYSTLVRR